MICVFPRVRIKNCCVLFRIRGRNREHWKPPINTWHLPGQTSTPLTLNAPPLKTPHGLQPQYTHPFGLNQPYPGFHGEGEYGQQNGHDFEEHPQGFEQNGEYDNVEEYQFQNGWDAEQEGYNQYGYQGNQFGERGEVDGGNEQVTGNHGHYGPGGYPYYNQINHQNGYGDQNQDYHHHGYQNNYYGERGYYGDQEGPDDNHNNPDVGLSPPEFASLPKRSPPQENYRVQYVGNRDKVPPVGQENGDNTVTQETNKQETEDEQDNFLKQGIFTSLMCTHVLVCDNVKNILSKWIKYTSELSHIFHIYILVGRLENKN